MAVTINASTTAGLVNSADTSGILQLQTANTAALTIDASQNVGLGVTPSAWGSVWKAVESGRTGNAFVSRSGGGRAILTSNTIFGASSDTYANTGAAAYFDVDSNLFKWYTAPSGTAGNAITFTQAMTLDASGNLGVGTTSPNSSSFAKAITLNGSTSAGYEVNIAGTNIGYLGGDSGQLYLRTSGANPLTFATNSTERARIDSSGNLLVGVTNTNPISNRTNGQVFLAAGGFNRRQIANGSDWGLNTTAGSICNFYSDNGSTYVFAGSISVNGSTAAYNTSSDYRLKNTIAPMTGALAKVALLKPVTYKWNADGSDGQGFIAHELAEVCPDAVTGEKDAVDAEGNPQYQGIDVSFLVATLTAAIQEQQALITQLQADVAALKGAQA
jgi:hypothetical protein